MAITFATTQKCGLHLSAHCVRRGKNILCLWGNMCYVVMMMKDAIHSIHTMHPFDSSSSTQTHSVHLHLHIIQSYFFSGQLLLLLATFRGNWRVVVVVAVAFCCCLLVYCFFFSSLEPVRQLSVPPPPPPLHSNLKTAKIRLRIYDSKWSFNVGKEE